MIVAFGMDIWKSNKNKLSFHTHACFISVKIYSRLFDVCIFVIQSFLCYLKTFPKFDNFLLSEVLALCPGYLQEFVAGISQKILWGTYYSVDGETTVIMIVPLYLLYEHCTEALVLASKSATLKLLLFHQIVVKSRKKFRNKMQWSVQNLTVMFHS